MIGHAHGIGLRIRGMLQPLGAAAALATVCIGGAQAAPAKPPATLGGEEVQITRQLPSDGKALTPDKSLTWPGMAIATGGKGYAPSPMGQIHYRDIGPRDSRVVFFLVHQSPMSMMEMIEIQNILAGMGYRTITLDNPGYGNSDAPKEPPTLDKIADNMVALMDYLKLPKVVMVGHHTGAGIVTVFAGRHSDRLAAMIVQGVPLLKEEDRLIALNRPRKFLFVEPKDDGEHLMRQFPPPEPGKPREARNADQINFATWMTVGVLQAQYSIFPVLYSYPHMLQDAKNIKVPGLILSDAEDVVFKGSLLFKEIRPDFDYVAFSQGNEDQFYVQRDRWTKLISAWAEKNAKTGPVAAR